MGAIHIIIDREVHIGWLEFTPPLASLEFVRSYPVKNSLVFYDWLEDETGKPCAIELHLLEPDMPFVEMLRASGCGEFEDDTPQVFVREVDEARPRHLEAFGDIQLLETSHRSGLILVGTDTWLSASDKEYLRNLALGKVGRRATDDDSRVTDDPD